ncbi:MAG: hypothetical protein JW934_09650 [Anaerolineae bacterium]|nr:hypothetical protein [Anaerolineae bacterium]
MKQLEQISHPERYHGRHKKPPFFEGWYYKLVDAAVQHRCAVIPGVFLGPAPEAGHCFVQVFDGVSGRATYHRYPLHEFQAAQGAFDVRIGSNHFGRDHLYLDIQDDQGAITGDLNFEGLTPWPVTLASPGAMGWYAWAPWMQCYHGVLSFDHAIHGKWAVNGQTVDWEGGRGYMEKDWGRAFPLGWVWMQSNHFEQPGTSLMVSAAHVPWLGRSFPGFTIGLWHERRLYRFATYTGARIERLQADAQRVSLIVSDWRHRLEVNARRASPTLLAGPSESAMNVRVPETMDAVLNVHLETTQQSTPIFSGTGRYAGLEVAGQWERLQR